MRYANSNSIKVRAHPNRRIARLVGNESDLAENVASVERRDSLPVAFYFRLALDNKIDLVAKVLVGEN